MAYFRGDLSLIISLLWFFLLPLEELDWIACEIFNCLINLSGILNKIVSDCACAENTFWQFFFILQNDSVFLNSHVDSVCWYGFEESQPCFVPLSFSLHPIWGHERGFLCVAALLLFESFSSVHMLGIHCNPAVNFGNNCNCLLIFKGMLFHHFEVVFLRRIL